MQCSKETLFDDLVGPAEQWQKRLLRFFHPRACRGFAGAMCRRWIISRPALLEAVHHSMD